MYPCSGVGFSHVCSTPFSSPAAVGIHQLVHNAECLTTTFRHAQIGIYEWLSLFLVDGELIGEGAHREREKEAAIEKSCTNYKV
jgi:hypothetical protein